MLDSDKVLDLKYYSNCFNESLRIQAPVLMSTSVSMMETVKADFVTIRKDDAISIDMWGLHHNKAEWIDPEKFIPDRFDPESKYFLTPSGKRRNPFSFAPFLGG
mmetsp:Transcript_99537/g.136786  ORF Transcript_99537/g.136786 Transcript_99537/m.136786 type:complete len:104 (+) Transcript_99537:1164-1475(+)